MGVAYFISVESTLAGVMPEDFDGKALARADDLFLSAAESTKRQR
jgi:hypothetical protein